MGYELIDGYSEANFTGILPLPYVKAVGFGLTFGMHVDRERVIPFAGLAFGTPGAAVTFTTSEQSTATSTFSGQFNLFVGAFAGHGVGLAGSLGAVTNEQYSYGSPFLEGGLGFGMGGAGMSWTQTAPEAWTIPHNLASEWGCQ